MSATNNATNFTNNATIDSTDQVTSPPGIIHFECLDCGRRIRIARNLYDTHYAGQTLCLCCRDKQSEYQNVANQLNINQSKAV